jgi:hypothetical protein
MKETLTQTHYDWAFPAHEQSPLGIRQFCSICNSNNQIQI